VIGKGKENMFGLSLYWTFVTLSAFLGGIMIACLQVKYYSEKYKFETDNVVERNVVYFVICCLSFGSIVTAALYIGIGTVIIAIHVYRLIYQYFIDK
jgi:hypothetical protein